MRRVLHSVYFSVLPWQKGGYRCFPWLMGFPKKTFVDFAGFVANGVCLQAAWPGGGRVDLRPGVVYLMTKARVCESVTE